jgi:hypothetical protein
MSQLIYHSCLPSPPIYTHITQAITQASSLFPSPDKENFAGSEDDRSDTSQDTNQTKLLRRSFIDDNRAGRGVGCSRHRNWRNRARNNGRNRGGINRRRNNNSSRGSLQDRRLSLCATSTLYNSSRIGTGSSTALTIADTAIRTASVLLVRSDFAVSCRRTSACLARTACPVGLDTAGAAILEVLVGAGNLYDLTDCEEGKAGGVLDGENAGG